MFPKTTVLWDTNVVLHYIKGSKQANELTLKELTLKLTMLLALLSTQRIQTLAVLNVDYLVIDKDKAVFRVKKLLKQSRPGYHLGDLEFARFSVCRRLCVVTHLKVYLSKTEEFRKSNRLLLSYIEPHEPVTSSTIRRWLKETLKGAGVDKHYTAHSTRGAASSKAAFCHVPIDSIMKSAGWTEPSTFQKHYQKPIRQFGALGLALLKSAQKK